MTTQRLWLRASTIAMLGAVALAGLTVLNASARSPKPTAHKTVRGILHATGADTNANGDFEENIEDGLPDSGSVSEPTGEITVRASNLAPRARFTVNAASTPVAAFRTNGAGKGQVRVKAKKLAVDPRGKHLSVTDSNGNEVLWGEVGDPTVPGATRCCLATADEQGCSDLLPAECAAAGGTDLERVPAIPTRARAPAPTTNRTTTGRSRAAMARRRTTAPHRTARRTTAPPRRRRAQGVADR